MMNAYVMECQVLELHAMVFSIQGKKANDFKKSIVKKIKHKKLLDLVRGFLNKKKFDFTSIIK